MNEDDLIKDAREDLVVLYVNDFTVESYKDFQENFLKAEHSGQTVIPVYIDSCGGEINTLFAMIDLFNSSELPVCTIAIGRAQSCGADLLAAGTKGYRYASPLASIMIHEGEGGFVGKPSDIKTHAAEELRVVKTTFELLDNHCGQTLGYWEGILQSKNNPDLFMTSAEAQVHGLVDYVKVPRFQPEIMVKTNIV